MKKFIYIFLPVLLLIASGALTSCSDLKDLGTRIDDLEVRVSKLETLCDNFNKNISGLQTTVSALAANDWITSVEEIEGGYRIAFDKSGTICIYNGKDGKDGINGKDGKDGVNGKDGAPGADGKDGVDGKDGKDGAQGADGKDGLNGKDGEDGVTPIIGVRIFEYDQMYYWTLNGEWLLDNENSMIRASGRNGAPGITPELKIEDGMWYVSIDYGTTWTLFGKATGADGKDGKDGDSMFKGVAQYDDKVVFTLADNTTLSVPRHGNFGITFDKESGIIPENEVFSVNYTLSYGHGNALVEAICDRGWYAEVHETSSVAGWIDIHPVSCGDSDVALSSKIVIIAYDGYGQTAMKVLHFEQGKFTLLDYATTVTKDAQNFIVDIRTNRNYEIESISEPWLTYVTTKAVRTDHVWFKAQANETGSPRSCTIKIKVDNGDSYTYYVEQTNSTWELYGMGTFEDEIVGPTLAYRRDVFPVGIERLVVDGSGPQDIYRIIDPFTYFHPAADSFGKIDETKSWGLAIDASNPDYVSFGGVLGCDFVADTGVFGPNGKAATLEMYDYGTFSDGVITFPDMSVGLFEDNNSLRQGQFRVALPGKELPAVQWCLMKGYDDNGRPVFQDMTWDPTDEVFRTSLTVADFGFFAVCHYHSMSACYGKSIIFTPGETVDLDFGGLCMIEAGNYNLVFDPATFKMTVSVAP